MTEQSFIPIMKPSLKGNELKYITECVETEWISSQGRFVTQFEEMIAEYLGVPYVVAVSNGTVALHLALLTLGIGVGDEVIVPDFTFAASVNAIIHAGAIPVLIDIDPNTLNIDTELIEAAISDRTKAIMPVHIYGNPCDMDRIQEIADKHKITLIEDAAEALGSEYKGKKVGSISKAATFSFFGNKNITTGEGGVVVFHEEEQFELAKVLRDHGMRKGQRYWHDVIGYNYRMTNMQAAIGVAQMERLDEIIQRKIQIDHTYRDALADVAWCRFQETTNDSLSSAWLTTLVLDQSVNRADLIEHMSNLKVDSRPGFYTIHSMPPYQHLNVSKFPVSEVIEKHSLCLPSYVDLTEDEINRVIDSIKSFGEALND